MSSDNTLSNVTINGSALTPDANGHYTFSVPDNAQSLAFSAIPTDPNVLSMMLISRTTSLAVATGTNSLSGTILLPQDGSNFVIRVDAQDGTIVPAWFLTLTNVSNNVVCFLGNAPVATPTGPQRIDSLKEGDLVLTETGASVPIQRLKVMRVRPGPTTNPYVIAKGTYGATEELLISPRHRVAVNGKMIEARDLGLPQKTMAKPFTYYNIELPGWANMHVAGVEVESLAPAKRVVATVEQVKAAIAAMKGPNTAETLKTLQRLCKRNADGTLTVYGAMKA